jgi:hypothetical protein
MSKSAKRVQEAFEETKDAIVSQQQPSRENRTSYVGKEGEHHSVRDAAGLHSCFRLAFANITGALHPHKAAS